MTDRISPALTPEEWVEIGPDPSAENSMWYVEWCESADRVWEAGSPTFHKAAALALYGQPFGFTREDVELLTVAAYVWRVATNGPTFDYGERMAPLRDRIAALLPPETP